MFLMGVCIKVKKIYEEMEAEKMILVKWICGQLILTEIEYCEQFNHGYENHSWKNNGSCIMDSMERVPAPEFLYVTVEGDVIKVNVHV